MPYKHKIPIYTENLNLTGAYFRHQRIIDGLSLTYVADSIRMNKGFLSDLENGKRNFPDGTINQLNDFYNLKFDDSLKYYIELENNIDEIFHALCNSNTFKEKQLLELILSKRDIYENSSGSKYVDDTRAEDASKISRMVDKFDLATIDTKAIRESVLSQKDIKPMSDEEHDALLSKLMDEKTNPELARMSKDGTPFEPSSKTLKKENKKKAVARKRSIATTDRPSVRKELQEIKQEKLKSAAPKMPVKNKSKKKVR